MKLRLRGTPEEVERATSRLAKVFTVVSVSPTYPDRTPSLLVRVYVDVRL
jgi:hypothetical protein